MAGPWCVSICIHANMQKSIKKQCVNWGDAVSTSRCSDCFYTLIYGWWDCFLSVLQNWGVGGLWNCLPSCHIAFDSAIYRTFALRGKGYNCLGCRFFSKNQFPKRNRGFILTGLAWLACEKVKLTLGCFSIIPWKLRTLWLLCQQWLLKELSPGPQPSSSFIFSKWYSGGEVSLGVPDFPSGYDLA